MRRLIEQRKSTWQQPQLLWQWRFFAGVAWWLKTFLSLLTITWAPTPLTHTGRNCSASLCKGWKLLRSICQTLKKPKSLTHKPRQHRLHNATLASTSRVCGSQRKKIVRRFFISSFFLLLRVRGFFSDGNFFCKRSLRRCSTRRYFFSMIRKLARSLYCSLSLQTTLTNSFNLNYYAQPITVLITHFWSVKSRIWNATFLKSVVIKAKFCCWICGGYFLIRV